MKHNYPKKGNPKSGETSDKSSVDRYSHAPYNFIPLNDKVINVDINSIPSFNTYHNDRYTGYISLEIETLTPLYIRDTFNDVEYNKMIESRGESLKDINSDFFSPGGLIRISGSSLRGMIRTLVEIVTFGKFTHFDDRKLYYRGFADKSKGLRLEYRKHINPRGGILKKEGLTYRIIPSNFQKFTNLRDVKISGYRGSYFSEAKYMNKEGYLITSINSKGRENYYFIEKANKNHKESILLSAEDIGDYKLDRERSKEVNILEQVDRAENREVPCFYSEYIDVNNIKRIAFGHTKMFRLPYKKSIGSHVPGELKKRETIDFAEAIFGRETDFASRVFFEDIYLVEPPNPVLPAASPKILSTPKPTSFQHYLVQNIQNMDNFPIKLAHYNDPNPIRGYKLYWHREADDWTESPEKVKEKPKLYTKISPVSKGAKFRGIIRFENLSKVELGALLFVLDLPADCAHKLGMGKPLGLGSIRITPELYLSDRQRRYRELFYEWNESDAHSRQLGEPHPLDTFKKEFELSILGKLSRQESNLWNHPRLKKLRVMLDFKNKPDNRKTAYLDLKEFKDRRVLPEPEDVIKRQVR